jgi:hypothetical protein
MQDKRNILSKNGLYHTQRQYKRDRKNLKTEDKKIDCRPSWISEEDDKRIKEKVEEWMNPAENGITTEVAYYSKTGAYIVLFKKLGTHIKYNPDRYWVVRAFKGMGVNLELVCISQDAFGTAVQVLKTLLSKSTDEVFRPYNGE